MTTDLITSARAKYNLNNATLTTAEDTTLAALITAVSRGITSFCRRDFASTSYDELYQGSDSPRLLLRHYPILSVARVAYAPAVVLRIKNNASANQRASVAVTATGLTLVRVASATTTSNTLAFADHTTLSALVTAVNALGNGWSAEATSSFYDNRASADLRALQGAFQAKDVYAGLSLHVQELASYSIDAERGWLVANHWQKGVNYWRVIYTAGYDTVPEDVQEACAQWVAALFWQSKRDPGLSQEHIPGVVLRSPFPSMPPTVRHLLEPYRIHDLSSASD